MVKSKRLRVLWDDVAKQQLKEEIKHIRKSSTQGADSVKKKIMETIKQLPDNHNAFETDGLKRDNDWSYHRFFAYSYRITYRVTEDAVLILRVRHTSREPLEY